MVMELLTNLGTSNIIFVTTGLVVFIYFFRKAVSIIKGCFFVGIASAIFPIAANKIMGMAIPLTLDSVQSFIVIGLGLYFIYMFGKTVYKAVSVAGKLFSWTFQTKTKPSAGKNKPSRQKKEDDK